MKIKKKTEIPISYTVNLPSTVVLAIVYRLFAEALHAEASEVGLFCSSFRPDAVFVQNCIQFDLDDTFLLLSPIDDPVGT